MKGREQAANKRMSLNCRAFVAWAMLLALNAATVAADPAEETPPAFPATPEELLARFKPWPPAWKGWAREGAPLVVAGEGTAQLRPERATLLAEHKPQWAVTFRLRPPTGPQCQLFIWQMKEPLLAFGLFSRLRPAEAENLPLGSSAYCTGPGCVVWQERLVVEAQAEANAAVGRLIAVQAAEGVLSVLPPASPWPLFMRLLPVGRQLPQTLVYYRRGLFDMLPFDDALAADYLENGTRLTMALVRYPTDEAARQAFGQTAALLGAREPGTPLPTLGRQAQAFSTTQWGLVFVVQEGRYLILALRIHDRNTAEGLLRITVTNIRIMR